jgi:hypothetical protein
MKRTPGTHWAPESVWTTWRSENSCPHRNSNSETLVVQPVASRYTDRYWLRYWELGVGVKFRNQHKATGHARVPRGYVSDWIVAWTTEQKRKMHCRRLISHKVKQNLLEWLFTNEIYLLGNSEERNYANCFTFSSQVVISKHQLMLIRNEHDNWEQKPMNLEEILLAVFKRALNVLDKLVYCTSRAQNLEQPYASNTQAV